MINNSFFYQNNQMRRKRHLVVGGIYHICNKSIANYRIFHNEENVYRFIQTVDYYNDYLNTESFSNYFNKKRQYSYKNLLFLRENPYVKFLSYVVMPDHYHLLVKILHKSAFWYVGTFENSYTRYFNLKLQRKGPLWQSIFRSVRVRSDEQLLHVSRYIHLNPTTSQLVENPEDWKFSSYKDFIYDKRILQEIITEISIHDSQHYRKFVEDQKDYQKKLKLIKKVLLE